MVYIKNKPRTSTNPGEIRKSLSFQLTASDHKLLEFEAAKQRISLTEYIRRLLAPELNRLRSQ